MTHMMEEKKTNDKKEKNKKKVKSQSRAHGDDVDVDQEEDIHSLSKASGFCSKYQAIFLPTSMETSEAVTCLSANIVDQTCLHIV